MILAINLKQDLVIDKLFQLNEPFQLINSRDKMCNGNRNKADFSAVCVAVLLCFRSILVSESSLLVTSANSIEVNDVTDTGWTNLNPLSLPDTIEIA